MAIIHNSLIAFLPRLNLKFLFLIKLSSFSKHSFSDLNSKIPVVLEPSGFQSILSGTGADNGVIQYIKKGKRGCRTMLPVC